MENNFQQSYTRDHITEVALQLRQYLDRCQVVTFTGSLGAGKTTLINALCRQMGVTDHVSSPTFTYVNIYTTVNGKKIYHFDLYRINTLDDFIMAGFDEYLYVPYSWAFIEWPAVIMPLLDHDVCHASIDYNMLNPNMRTISVFCTIK
jgi:tRNA threonylcarbamoyladenosine biosynthesis protein TsaE